MKIILFMWLLHNLFHIQISIQNNRSIFTLNYLHIRNLSWSCKFYLLSYKKLRTINSEQKKGPTNMSFLLHLKYKTTRTIFFPAKNPEIIWLFLVFREFKRVFGILKFSSFYVFTSFFKSNPNKGNLICNANLIWCIFEKQSRFLTLWFWGEKPDILGLFLVLRI